MSYLLPFLAEPGSGSFDRPRYKYYMLALLLHYERFPVLSRRPVLIFVHMLRDIVPFQYETAMVVSVHYRIVNSPDRALELFPVLFCEKIQGPVIISQGL